MKATLARGLAAIDRRSALAHRLLMLLLAGVLRSRRWAAGDSGALLELIVRHPRGGVGARLAAGAEPGAVRISIRSDDLILLAGGAVGWPRLLAGGRLQVAGDPFLALAVLGALGLPVAAGAPLRTLAIRRHPRR